MSRVVALVRQPLLWLCVMLALFFYKEVFLGLSFSPADQLFITNPWAAVKPSTFTAPSNDLRSDESLINYPHRVDISSDIKTFGLPLWQDHTLAGSANTFSLHNLGSFAYPPFFVFLLTDPRLAGTIVHVSLPLYAGLSMYLLLGRMVRRRSPRLLGALAFALNGYSLVWLSAFPLPAIVASLPLAVYLAWRLLEEKAWLLGALFSIVVAGTLIVAYPPGSLILVILVAIFGLCWWLQGPRQRTVPVIRLALLGVLALGLSAVATVPTIQELANYTSKPYRGAITSGIPLRFLANFIYPNIAGNPIAHDWRAIGNYCEFVAYAGSLPLILALGGGLLLVLRRLRANPLALCAMVSGIVCFSLAYIDPVIRVVDSHAPFNNLNPGRWNMGVEFAVAILAAYMLDQLLESGRAWREIGSVVAGGGAMVAGAAVLLYVKRHEFVHVDNFITRDYRVRLALLAADVLVLAWIIWGPRRNIGAMAAIAVVFVDMFTFGVDFNPAIPADQQYPSTPAIRYLQANSAGYRILPVDGPYGADTFTVYGLDVITGYDHFRDDGYVALLGHNMSPLEVSGWSGSGYLTLGDSLHLDDQVFNELSVKYAYFPTTDAAAPAASALHWGLVYSGSDGVIYENHTVLPKQFLVSDITCAGEICSPAPIAHTAARPDRDQLQVPSPGRLVWSKPFSRDWKISVNGQPVTAEPYNGYFLSANLTQPATDVSLSYQPSSYRYGALVSAASLLVLVAFLVVTWRRRDRDGAAPIRASWPLPYTILPMERPSLAIVIPARNEAPRLPGVLATLPISLTGVGEILVIVVDDGSTDGTGARAREHGARVARHVVNLGKGAALQTGCDAALAFGAEIIVAMDADGQHQAVDLPRLLAPLLAGEADVTLTYREATGGTMPAVLKFGNTALSSTLKFMFGVDIRDTQCGLRAFTSDAYPRLRWEARDYSVESEMLVRMARNHLRYVEVPIATVYADRYKGTQPIDGVKILGQLLRLRLGG